MWLLENPVSATFLALLATCAVTVTFLALKEHAFVGRPRQATVGGGPLTPADAGQTERTLGALLEQVQQTARNIDGSLRERLAQLESASREANARVQDLERLARQTGELEHFARTSEARLNPTVESNRPRFLTESTNTTEPPQKAWFERQDQTRDENATWRSQPSSGSSETSSRWRSAGTSQPELQRSRVADFRAAQVCELVDAGTAPINIAEALDMTLGEVELILNLRNMR